MDFLAPSTSSISKRSKATAIYKAPKPKRNAQSCPMLLPLYLACFLITPAYAAKAETEALPEISLFNAESFRTAEYKWSYALASVKAANAYGRGWTGKFQTIAVFDTGINPAHKEFAGQIAGQYNVYTQKEGAVTDTVGHGTFVSGIIAARKDNVGMHGIAFDSKILAIKIDDSRGRLVFSNNQMAAGIEYALKKGARIFNNSWGTSSFITAFNKSQLEASLGTMLTAYRKAARFGTIIVFAAGNDGKEHPGMYAALPLYYTELKDSWLAAVATGTDGRIASYSNRCGHAAAWCLAAPGSSLISTMGNGYSQGSGTSFAAPVIAAAAGVLKQQWPHLTNAQIKDILFRTANKTGIYADVNVYGQGFLDLGRATQPVGTVGVPTSGNTNTKTPTTQSVASFGRLTNGLQMADTVETIVLDDFGRDFVQDTEVFFVSETPSFDSLSALQNFGVGLDKITQNHFTLAFSSAPDSRDLAPGTNFEGARMFADYRGKNFGAATAINLSPSVLFGAAPRDLIFDASLTDPDAAGMAYLGLLKNPTSVAATYHLNSKVYASAGMLYEEGTLLGAGSSGASALSSQSQTSFMGLSAQLDMGSGYGIFGGYDYGVTRSKAAANSLVSDLSSITSSAYRVGVHKTGLVGELDQLGFIMSKPLQIESGVAGLSVPTSRNLDDTVNYSATSGDLASKSELLDWQAFYSTPIDANSRIKAGLMLRTETSAENSRDEAIFLARYNLNF